MPNPEKRPYKHILKNLFHEQAAEIIPLVYRGFEVKRAMDVEMPALKTTPNEEPPSVFDEGLVSLILPTAKVTRMLKTEWVEHSGRFERAYRAQGPDTDQPVYLVIEFQTEREDEKVARHLLANWVFVDRYATQDMAEDDDDSEVRHEDTHKITYVYPIALCPFPQSAPEAIHDTFMGMPLLTFKFERIDLWEKDAREILNTHVSACYFLLPAMKNADAALLGVAIGELAQRFQGNDEELGRHLTGLHVMLQQSDLLSEEEKLAAQEHLKPFMHLIKNDTYDA